MKGYTMQYYILQKLNEDYFSVEKVRKPINTFDEAVKKVNALIINMNATIEIN